jgi:branched-chain amino acid transport system ATP-binding protein/urea transport system ATP-binding protein
LHSAEDSQPVLRASGISVSFGRVKVLDGVDFALRKGEVHCLIGPNGAGKSTLFRVLTGQLPRFQGEVLIKEKKVSRRRINSIAKLGIGAKTQIPNLFPTFSPAQHIEAAAMLAGKGSERALELIDEFELQAVMNRAVCELSHGIRQRTEIAMVLAREPEIVLLDEPAAGLSSIEARKLVTALRRELDKRSLVVVEHDMQFVSALADRVTTLHRGRVIASGLPERVLADRNVRQVYLGKELNATT